MSGYLEALGEEPMEGKASAILCEISYLRSSLALDQKLVGNQCLLGSSTGKKIELFARGLCVGYKVRAVLIHWTGLPDWTTGLDYWTHPKWCKFSKEVGWINMISFSPTLKKAGKGKICSLTLAIAC